MVDDKKPSVRRGRKRKQAEDAQVGKAVSCLRVGQQLKHQGNMY